MADIALGIVGKIIEVGLDIKNAIETVEQNREDCEEIESIATRVTGILKGLEEANMIMDDPTTRDALKDIEDSLRNALGLVTACQQRHIVCLFCKANDLSKKLRRVQDHLERRVMIGLFAINIKATIILTNIGDPPQPQEIHQKLPKPDLKSAKGLVHVLGVCLRGRFGNAEASSSETTNESRTEMDIVKDNNVIEAESNTPFASLHEITKFSLAEVENATYHFSDNNLIGKGGFSNVYKGTLQDKQVVAIKVFKRSHQLQLDRKGARELLDILCEQDHRNIVKLLGYVHEEQVRMVEYGNNKMISATEIHFCLVQEYMSNGDLERINSGSRANWSTRLQLIDGIAQGINYLHGQHIVHMDLKPANILLDSEMNAKITDFGISRIFDDTHNITTDLVGTMGYIAPEFVLRGEIWLKADVYSFGIILLGTIISGLCKGEPPSRAASIEWAMEARGKNDRELRELFDPSLFDDSQLKQIKTCLHIGLACIEMDREKRPTMAEVVNELDRIEGTDRSLENPSLLRPLNTLTSGGSHK